MNDVIKEFFVSLGFKADPSLKQFESTMQGITGTITKWAGLLTGGVIAGAFAEIAHEAEKLDKLNDFAFRVNSTTEEIQRLGYVAQLSGSNIDDVKSSLEGLSSAAGQTAMGVGRAKVIFQKLGISVLDANGGVKDSLALFSEVSKSIQNLSRSQQISILDKLGINRSLLETMTKDIGSLEAEFDQMYKAAGIDSKEAAKNAALFNDALDRLKFTFSIVSEKISEEFLGTLTDSIDFLRKSMVNAIPAIVSTLVPVLKVVIKVIGDITHLIAGFIEGVKALNSVTGGFLPILGGLILGMKALNAVMRANPIGLVIAAITGLITVVGLLIDDFQTFKEGGKAFINWEPFIKGIDYVTKGFAYLSDVVVNYVIKPIENLIGLISQLGSLWDSIKEKLGIGSKGGASLSVVSGVAGNGVPILANGGNVSNSNRNVTYNNPITITVTGSSSPQDTANAISATQSRLSQNMVRNMQGNVR